MVICSAAFVSAPSLAQDKETFETIAVFSGSMHAMVGVCGGYAKEQLDLMKSEQKKMVEAVGITADEFDALFDKGYAEGKSTISNASESEKKQLCEQLKAIQQ